LNNYNNTLVQYNLARYARKCV